MKKLVFAALLCVTIAPAFAMPSFAYKVGDLPPRIAIAKENSDAQMSLRNISRDDMVALLAVGITLLAYKIRNKRIVLNKNK